jgi:hypothetical protein
MCDRVFVKHTQQEIYQELAINGLLAGIDFDLVMQDMKFYEYTLADCGLPTADELLIAVKKIEESVGIQGWENQGAYSNGYKGFSLTYNPDFLDKKKSLYHQTWGSSSLIQNFSRIVDDRENIGLRKNTYYDTYAFRKIPKIVQINLYDLLNRLSMPILRSRVAYVFHNNNNQTDSVEWHKDEFPYQLLRINIPLTSEPCYVLDIDGTDEHGNHLQIYDKYLEPGKIYIWNTRIPHRIRIKEQPSTKDPRISLVLGLSPYFDYDNSLDSFSKSSCWGVNINNIVVNQLFLNK